MHCERTPMGADVLETRRMCATLSPAGLAASTPPHPKMEMMRWAASWAVSPVDQRCGMI